MQYCSEISVIGEASNGAEGRKAIMDLNPDIVFLDISMPDMSGFDVANSIPDRNFYLIFQTAYSDFAIQAVNCNAAGYLLKPISISSLQQTVKRVIELNEKKRITFSGLSMEEKQRKSL
ncbi:MAG: response regulator [Ignavibacteria bacterium]|nr:response regulator [Ignavibacteria bacterium]